MSNLENEILALDLDWDLLNHLALPESVARIKAEQVNENLIEDDEVLEVFRWQIGHYREYGYPATASVLEDEFDEITLEEPLAQVDDLIGRLRKRYVQNHGREAIEELIDTFKDDPIEMAEAMYNKGREFKSLTSKRGETFGTGDYDRSMIEYDKMVLAGKGPSLGYEELDDHFYGQRGLTFCLGAPKSMKSWITVNSVIENVINGKSVVLYSLELPAHEAYNRIQYMAANIPWWKFIKGALGHDERQKLKEASELLDGCGTLNVIKPSPGDRKVDPMIDRAHDLNADVIYIDQLQYMETNGGRSVGAKNDTGDYWDVCAPLRDYSDDVPIWVVHQFNRGVMNADELPAMQQIKGSAAIEETATLALGLWANKDMKASKVMQVGTLAARNHEWYNWELNIKMSRECQIEMVGQVYDE